MIEHVSEDEFTSGHFDHTYCLIEEYETSPLRDSIASRTNCHMGGRDVVFMGSNEWFNPTDSSFPSVP